MSTAPASVFDRLRRAIREGDHAPGAPLRLSALAQRYAVSHTPLREALSRLEQMGFVVAEPNRGWRVAPVSLGDLDDLARTRLVLERELVRAAMASGGVEWEAGIVAAHHRLARTPPPSPEAGPEARRAWRDAHEGFHMALVAGAGIEWLLRFYATTREQLERAQQALSRHPGRIASSTQPDPAAIAQGLRDATALPPHSRLMEAVLSRDAARAETELAAHGEITARLYRALSGG